ncbi:hypothetical protein G6F46_009737 [Rhizopus delemar]|uniref:SAC domain-containing protein n=2 Tax=Rhizopus TaxID=4842 RepID=A0A9P6YWG6_9FUNG|nr:hypothetical protein G6F55_008686 [Rhizopus delemar]KAG1538359.1 hypothetical protein G6F51_009819 [Rhizopus arrhizus]KAG1492795.1 hypothetical protein G6F54_009041 [Rhizopus delemar]KAG1506683.1 hypothetical protein G6F53_009511 [Rhizopus delemar]KAG1546507.1 hypothetical protein G6F49_010480 [Rhizopus delemar]
MLFEQSELRITNEAYLFTPLYEPAKGTPSSPSVDTLTIYRDSGELQLNAAPPVQNSRIQKQFVVYGIFGFIELLAGEYMIVITGCKKLGTLMQDCDVYQATTFQILPIPRNTNGLSVKQLEDEQTYIHLLQNHLKSNGFYFSYKYNITLSIQKQIELSANSFNDWTKADERFFWNKYLSTKIITASQKMKAGHDLNKFILPVIQGFVSIKSAVINNRSVTFALISRRSQERAGTRYFSRGLDEQGSASNFVETEQLLLCDPSKSLVQTNSLCLSYMQTRGSVPAVWRQIPNIRYTPYLWIDSDLSNEKVIEASRFHFELQVKHYGPQILVNLVNRKGYEHPVGETFAKIINQLKNPSLKYIHFDFHHECRKMRWNRVQLLIDQLEQDLRQQGFCFYDMTNPLEPKLRQKQTSVVRTNCMDCLDRTNVVQSTISRWVLNRQLREAGILQSTEVIENDEQFMQIFKNMWADNADALSVSYSGTGALKTDFTRTGKRTYIGAVNDLVNSILRYIKNNYLDGSRQDGIDLILGKYKVIPITTLQGQPKSPFQLSPTFIFPELMGITSSLFHIILLSFLFAAILASWSYIQQHGTEFVNWPKLIPLSLPKIEDRPLEVNSNQEYVFSRHTPRRSSAANLNELEQGYELPALKKTT